MKPLTGSIAYGKENIPFELLFVDRKSMEIAVHPDNRVVVKAPVGAELIKIQARLTKRAGWIKRQRDYFGQFDPRTPARRYVGGESHLYLGRRYRLKIIRGEVNHVKLMQGYFRIAVNGAPTPERIKQLLDKWYLKKAREWFLEVLSQYLPEFGLPGPSSPKLSIRRMKTRWGSLSPNCTLTLNVDLIRAPKECIEYVVAHELCHMKHRQHNGDFYRLLEQRMPDWEMRKHKLELSLT